MNFPLELPIFQLFYWLVNTPGVGSGIVGLIIGSAVLIFALTLRWIFLAKDTSEASHPFPPEK